MEIRIFYDNISFRIRKARKTKELINKIIVSEKRISGTINIIITTDRELIKVNREFLKHDYFTDVISFSYNENKIVNGEIYISIDTIKRNSKNYNVSLTNELLRVIIHGILHLCDYEDGTDARRMHMRKMENYWMNIFSKE
jgi:probable rRNA maturation factor